MKAFLVVLLPWFSIAAVAAAAPDAHVREVEAWRAERVAKLTAPDGWLTLVGLHFLPPGNTRIGRAKDNDVVLAAGPAHLGVVTLTPEGRVSLAISDGVAAQIDGTRARHAELIVEEGARKPTLVTSGTMTLFAVDRGGRKALRVKDSEAPRRKEFVGLDHFPVDPKWRIVARWEAFERSRLVPITSMLGQTAPEPVPGRAVFEHGGRTYELLPIDEGREHPLFFVISDATSGKETYGASRFLYVEWPKEGATTIVLDFNRAENPPCAFTPFSTCPLPPKENRLPFAIRAGEKTYRGAHD